MNRPSPSERGEDENRVGVVTTPPSDDARRGFFLAQALTLGKEMEWVWIVRPVHGFSAVTMRQNARERA